MSEEQLLMLLAVGGSYWLDKCWLNAISVGPRGQESPALVSSYKDRLQCEGSTPVICVANDGRVYCAWEARDGKAKTPLHRIYVRQYFPSHRLFAPELLVGPGYWPGDISGFDLAHNGGKSVYLVYTTRLAPVSNGRRAEPSDDFFSYTRRFSFAGGRRIIVTDIAKPGDSIEIEIRGKAVSGSNVPAAATSLGLEHDIINRKAGKSRLFDIVERPVLALLDAVNVLHIVVCVETRGRWNVLYVAIDVPAKRLVLPCDK